MNSRSVFSRSAAWFAALFMVIYVHSAPQVVHAQTMLPEWKVNMPVTDYYNYTAAMLARDATGNTYVAGDHLFGYLSTTKWDSNGNLVWEKQFSPATGILRATWANLDPSGNVVVTGSSFTGASDANGTGWVVVKYDAQGNLLWNLTYSYSRGRTVRMEIDAAGNIYIVGRAWFGTDDILVKKISPSGTELWTKQIGLDATSIDAANSIAITPAGDVAVTGGPLGWMILARYDTNGNEVWTRTLEHHSGNAVTFGANNEVIVTGVNFLGASGSQAGIVKYDAAGNLLWNASFAGNVGNFINLDSQQNIIISGYIAPLAGSAYLDWYTDKVSPGGSLIWTQRYNEHQFNDEFPYFQIVGADDAIYVSGSGGPGPTTGNLSFLDGVLVKYLPDGTRAWTYYDPFPFRILGIRLDANQDVTAVGTGSLTVMHFNQSIGPVNQPPTAMASGTPVSGNAPLTVTFSSAGSNDVDGTIASYSWAFGDGGSSTAANPTHTYTTPGDFVATLTVTDNLGAQGTATVSISAIDSNVNQPPNAVATAFPSSGPAPLTVTFSSAGSGDSDGTIVAYSWVFGDGGTSTEANPLHTYTTAGSYTVTLTVTDNDGAQTSTSVAVTITGVTTSTRLHVAAQTVTRILVKGTQYLGQDVVLVQDEGGQPIAGATVNANYSGPNSGSAKATTGTSGTATLKSKKFSNPSTQWCFTVTNLTKAGYSYDSAANVVTTQCENGPASVAVEVAESVSIYPNPFNPETTIDLQVGDNTALDLRIYNVLGQEVAVLVRQEILPAGQYQYRWNGTDLSGQQLPTGIYYLRMIRDGDQEVFSLSLVK